MNNYKKYSVDSIIGPDIISEPVGAYGLISAARQGISKSGLINLSKQSGLSIKSLSRFLSVTERTIQRLDDTLRFKPDVSERILMIAQLYANGFEVFGDKDKFRTWMGTYNISLGNVTPISLMDTAIGINILNNELQKIAHGITA